MNHETRKIIDNSFTGLGFVSVFFLFASLIIVLAPIFVQGIGAFVFEGTSEFRRLNYERFDRGSKEDIRRETEATNKARQYVYETFDSFYKKVEDEEVPNFHEYTQDLEILKELIHELFGPRPGATLPVMMRDRFGKTRWVQALEIVHHILYVEKWDYSSSDAMGKKIQVPRSQEYKGTELENFFLYLEDEKNLRDMFLPKWTFYWQFLIDESFDSHIFGGIKAEVLGTLYLVIGTMIFAIPFGVIAALYLVEFSRGGKLVSLLRVCISTLAGVPSIVFGLFGLAFFINTMKVSNSKSVLAGSLTLALLVMPTIIRASEEAIRAVPHTYKEAALSLGASKIRTVFTVILPAAFPGILTGIVISMGRAAGETAPIIFTAAVSVGRPLSLIETLTQPTPALPWNIYNLVTEHEAVDQIRHVQFGMVFTLVMVVLILNLGAIIMRARIAKKLKT